jgi:hypothetical protein
MEQKMKRMYIPPIVEFYRVVLDEVIAFSPVQGADVEGWVDVPANAGSDNGDITLPF